ncbi:hypothetical protein HZH68_012583 [Vespula germanica]|uniref:Odorant receptor n=1 Tax=Vespula germanica TaxID=30212 RepID=A0A834JHR1_VESGE|nr:hypothetical protein HZH68_012583 [Vespula germanica]
MSLRGVTYYEQHFLFSSRVFQFLIRTRPDQTWNEQLFLVCAVIVYVLPIVLYQFYQLYTLDTKLQSVMKVFESMIPALYFLYCYYKISINLTMMKLLFDHIKFDYESVTDEEEFKIIEKYTNRTKLYVYVLIVLFYLNLIFITCPSIISVVWYIFGTSDDIRLILPFSINNVLQAGLLYYILLIYQIFGSFAIVTIGSMCYSSYWMSEIFSVLINVREMIEGFAYMAVFLFISYISFYVGQLLINHSNDAFEELCNIPFYNLSIRTQKLLLFLLTRSIKPIELSIGGIFVASHVVYAGRNTKYSLVSNMIVVFKLKVLTMSLRGLCYYEHHFLLSNRLVQLIIGLRPHQTSIQAFFIFSAITVYVLPMILHQFYQLFTSDIKSLLTADLLEKILGAFSVVSTYSTIYFCFATIKMIFAHLKFDYEQLREDDQFEIMDRYMKESKLYITIIVGICNLYVMSITIPSVSKVILHIFGLLDDIHLTLPLPVNNIVNPGPFYYSLLTIRKPFKNNQDYIEMTCCNITPRDEFDWIVEIIKRYSRVTELMFQLSTILHNTNKLIEYIAAIVGSIFTIYINFYIGQMLINHSNEAFQEL